MGNIFSFVEPISFVVSLVIGLLYVHYMKPEQKIVLKFPTPFNVDSLMYKDKVGTCYKYRMREVICPTDKSKIYPHELEE